jgi:type II secretory pathway pseudopilin PulG
MGNHSGSTPRHSSQSWNPFFFFFARNGTGGFTAIEFIVVIVMLGILAGTVISRGSLFTMDYSLIAEDQLIADIQYVQMRAIGIGKNQGIELNRGLETYTIQDENGNIIETKQLPKDIRISTTNFIYNLRDILKFNSMGEPYFADSTDCPLIDNGCLITISGNKTIMVYRLTGKTCKFDITRNECLDN